VQYAGADLAAALQEELSPLSNATSPSRRRREARFFGFAPRRARPREASGRRRVELQRRTSHLFVDEFQDTDPLQAEILLLLAADDRTRPIGRERAGAREALLVGDPKQSIYRFRRAEVALYQAVKNRLLAQGASLLHLVTNTIFISRDTLARAATPANNGNNRNWARSYLVRALLDRSGVCARLLLRCPQVS